MNKYQNMFMEQMETRINMLLQRLQGVKENELYLLLHSIKGTGGTMGMPRWSEEAVSALKQVDEGNPRLWSREETELLLQPFVHLLKTRTLKHGDSPAEPAAVVGRRPPAESEPGHERPFLQVGTPMKPGRSLVLLVDDDLGLLCLLKDTLEAQGMMVLATPSPDRAREWFYELKPDCVVLDIVLEQDSGFNILQDIREKCEQYLVPTLLMTGKSDRDTRLRSYRSGADDFIVKPFDPEEFAVRVERQISRRKRLTSMLLLDGLTGVYNATFFRQELERHLEESSLNSQPLTLAELNLDGFARINADYGFEEGDRVLQSFAAGIRGGLRRRDIWARDRSDRFLLLQPGLNEEEARACIQDMLDTFGARTFYAEGRKPYSLSVTAGIASVRTSMPADAALDEAHEALEAAKQGGGGYAAVYRTGAAAAKRSDKIRVAVIDDDGLMRSMLTKRLGDLAVYGLEVRSFESGEQFFEESWHREGTRCLVILDRMLPGMSGMDVLRRIRGDQATAKYTVMMLTGLGEKSAVAEALRAGTDDYVTKPFELQDLEARIERMLGELLL
ncbi:response regulator [Paenibacillus sp. JX-17]|uniref:Response regulator n=1 Tax=Paenibacillus lacisoli TaxID=3064525 RepID=A0ABT9CBU5_9BACL|nr:response regulator [Paenibacillus sp. JX-17]MDO7906738.1 response regulator [Paenibacillus sp. JX-17]